MKEHILIVEDEKEIADILELYLSSEDYVVTRAENGVEGLRAMEEKAFDLIICDLMMPLMDGYEFIKKIRQKAHIPIIILSAKSHMRDKILGLNIGADDYMIKPFEPLEVLARIHAHLRRHQQYNRVQQLTVKNLCLDIETVQLLKDGCDIVLTATEFKIIKLMMTYPDRIFSKVQIAESISGEYLESDDHTITVHISNLREKIGLDHQGDSYIKTIKGLGYKIES